MQVDALVFHVEQAACDVRAVVSHTFQICQQVGQHKACGQRTFAADVYKRQPMHSASSKSAAKSSRVMCFFISRPPFFVFLYYIVQF